MGRTILYGALIANLQEAIAGKKLDEKYRFLHKYEYKLGHDQLVEFGAEQLWNLGRRIHGTYGKWLGYKTPYVRTTTQQRMRDSARWWMAGYHSADSCKADSDATKKGCRPPGTDISTYHPDVIITEAPGYNNTLSHETCPAFEDTDHGSAAARPFVESFTKAIAMRLNHDLDLFDTPAEIGAPQVLYIMDLCPFETVANFDASHAEKYTLPPLSPFCHLFTEPEWQSYGYYQSISKYYGFGPGNPLGPAQGVGWVNELIARLTDTPVEDSTTTNSSLPFELGRGLYADFSHDNDMMSIFAALKLFDNTRELPKEYVVGPESAEAAGYSAAWAVPFGGRLVVEKMVCTDAETGRMGDVEEAVKEKVRVLMNDRVVPLQWCGGGLDGKCALEEFVDGMSWAREGGNWNECFAESGASL